MIKELSPLPKFLVSNYKKWRSSIYSKNTDKFKKLASFGQHPSSMIISCCDSRVHATSIFGVDEGEFFIHRNIANLVPSYSSISTNCSTYAAIEFAIKKLKIKHLIILGHRDCGGIKNGHSFHSNNFDQDYDFLNRWLDILLPAYKNAANNNSEEKQIEKMEEESIKISLKNLLSIPYIEKAVKNKNLSIHGLIHDIGSGELKYLNPLTEEFEKL